MTDRELTFEDACSLLARDELEVDGRMPWSSNRTFLAHLTGDVPARVIYKPVAGERPLWDFPPHTLGRREVAAAFVSEALGWRIVPPTIWRDGPLGPGMVQLFIPHDPDEHFFTLRELDGAADRFRRFAAFDIVINNADRKSGHCLRAADGTIWGIDHGVAFSSEPKLRTVIWDYVGEVVPAAIIDDLCRLDAALRAGSAACERLAEMLATVEMVALQNRLQRLVQAGRFPEPFTDYPYPWPMV